MTVIIQITETDGVNDSIVIHKPQMFFSFTDPEFMDYINDKVATELNPPDMSEWELEEVLNDLEDLKINAKRKRGRPKGSKGKKTSVSRIGKKVELIDENFMED